MLPELLHMLPVCVRHFLMVKLGVYELMHDPDEWFGYACCDNFISKTPILKKVLPL